MISNNIKLAMLDSGQIIEYDILVQDNDRFTPNHEIFQFIGTGHTYKPNETEYNKKIHARFYRYKREKK